MYLNAYKCNACGFLSKSPGIHCNAQMVPVVVLDNVMLENRGDSTPPQTVFVREVAQEKKEELTWQKFK